MSEIKYAPQITEDKDKEDIAKVFDGFFKHFPQLANMKQEEIEISFEHTVAANWSCIWNKIPHMGKIATPLATKDWFTLVVIHEDKQTEIYRNEDLDQIIKPKTDGTTQTVSDQP